MYENRKITFLFDEMDSRLIFIIRYGLFYLQQDQYSSTYPKEEKEARSQIDENRKKLPVLER